MTTQSTQSKNTTKPNLENSNFPGRKVKLTNSTYRMKPSMKAMLDTVVDPLERGQLKRALIEAEVSAQNMAIEMAKRKEKKST